LVGRPTDLFFIIKRQKRGRVPNLDSLKKELWNENLAKKEKKHEQSNYGRHPLLSTILWWFVYNRHFSWIYFLFRIAHLSYVGFVLLGDLLGNIEEELQIQKLPAKVPGVILIYF
jgi:hypothetical protein